MTREPIAFATRRQGGFTLLELLLATAIGAIVLVVINTTFFAALRLHNTTHDKIDLDLELQRTLVIVRRDLAGIRMPPNPQATTYSLSGQLQSDSFTSTTMDSTGSRITPDIFTNSGRIDGWSQYSEAQMVSYFLAPASDGGPTKSLVRVVTRNLLSATDMATEDQTLLPGVISAAIAFYDGSDWVDTWDSTTTTTLPTAIKFSLVLAPRETNGNTRIDPPPVEVIVPVIIKTTTSAQEDAAAATSQ